MLFLDALGLFSYFFDAMSIAKMSVLMQTRSPAILPSFSALLEGSSLSPALNVESNESA